MKKVNRQLVSVLYLAIFPFITTVEVFLEETQGARITPDHILSDNDLVVVQYNQYEMTIIANIDRFDFLFIPENADTVQAIGEKEQYRYLINGSFFDGNRLHAQHAGWLKIFATQYAPVKVDRQLSHVVTYNPVLKNIKFTHVQKFKSDARNQAIEFQTGPLVIENNNIAKKYIEESINGRGRYKRTLLAAINKRRVCFIVVRKPVALTELAEYLLTLSIFSEKRLDVINLDGGPSVALYARAFPELNFNETARLPILLGVR